MPAENTRPTPGNDPCLCFELRRAARAVSRDYDRWLKPTGLKTTQFSVLSMASGRGPVSITELAEALGMERTSLTRNLRPLEARGLLRVAPEGWKRTRLVEITREGRAVLETALPLWAQAQQALKAELGDGQVEQLKALLAQTGAQHP